MKQFINQILIIAIIALLMNACGPKGQISVQSGKVKKGRFNVEVFETGEVNAVNAINVSAPAMSWRYGMLKIIKIVEDGKDVKQGDTVVIFDPSEVQKAIMDAQAELEIANAELLKRNAEQEQKIDELEADLMTAKITCEISQIEMELSSYEAEIKKKEINLNLERSKISLDRAGDEINNQKKIQNEETKQINIRIQQLQRNLEEAKSTLNNLTVITPASGIAIIKKNWSTGNKFQVGDQTWSGNAMIDLPDLRLLKVVADINEVDISKIKLNQSAEIRLDAYADSVFKGKIISIASLAKSKDEKKQKVKVFPTEILINGSSKLLMPGMSVSTKILIDKIEDVLFVPLVSLFKEEGKDFVYLKDGNSYKKQFVVTGLTNNDFAIISSGLEEGDVIALSEPITKKENGKANKK